ncbi:hypothetical protein K1719_010035 [Acacia pycnantha]|nr:hypothetical protein K1719_010035 [Acacia pycnantha]
MEFRYTEESKSWSEESGDDRSEHNEERGISTGRSYGCVFCKRGFTTAQALGGHMNIHRKDRAKSTKSSFSASTSTKMIEDHEIDHTISSSPPENYFSSEVDNNSNYNYNYPPSQSAFPAEQYCDQRDRDVFGGDYNWMTGLSLSSTPLYVSDNKEKIRSSSEEDGLDLELRLGSHS